MRKIDRRIIITFILIFTIGLAFGLMRYLISLKAEPFKKMPPEVTRFVEADTVVYKQLISPIIADGRTASVSQLDVVSEASGRILIDRIPLKKGARFKKGDLLFTIYPDEAELALKARKSQFLTLLINLIPDIRLDYPEFEETFLDFYNSIDVDQTLPELPKIANQPLYNFLASRSVLNEYYSISRDQLSFQRRSIYAPFDGTYTEVYLEAGAYINTGGRVAHAIRTDELEIEVPLERFHSEFVQIHDPVVIHSDLRNMQWTGRVIRKSQFVDPGTQSQAVFVLVKNSTGQPMFAGEWLSVHFEGQPVDRVMEIKRNAIFNSNEVFIITDGHLEKKTIDIVKVNEQTLLFRGLDEGTIVVNQPLINVMEGTPVSVLGDTTRQNQAKQKGVQNKQGKQEDQ